MTKADISQIMTKLAIIETKMQSVEKRVSRLERILIGSVGAYFLVTVGIFVQLVLKFRRNNWFLVWGKP